MKSRRPFLALVRRANYQARINAKHDLASAIVRLAQGERPEAYLQELARWAKLLGYGLDGVVITTREWKRPRKPLSGPSVDLNQKTHK